MTEVDAVSLGQKAEWQGARRGGGGGKEAGHEKGMGMGMNGEQRCTHSKPRGTARVIGISANVCDLCVHLRISVPNIVIVTLSHVR